MKTRLYINRPLSTLHPEHLAGLQQVLDVAQKVPFPYWPGKAQASENPSRRPENNKKLSELCGLQSVLNIFLDQELRERGFQAEPVLRPHLPNDDKRLDHSLTFSDGRILALENEFGNGAHALSNFHKFTEALNHGRAALCGIICPLSATARITTGGSITYEATVQELRNAHPDTFRGPVFVIGVDHAESEMADFSQSRLAHAGLLSGNNDKGLIWHVVSQYRAGVPLRDIDVPANNAHRHAKLQQRVRAETPQMALI